MTNNAPTAIAATTAMANATVNNRPVACSGSSLERVQRTNEGCAPASSRIVLDATRGAAGSTAGKRSTSNVTTSPATRAAATTTRTGNISFPSLPDSVARSAEGKTVHMAQPAVLGRQTAPPTLLVP